MLDWPSATTILGVLGTVCVALCRVMPKQRNGNGFSGRESGEISARLRAVEHEVQNLRQAVGRIEGSLGCKP